MAVTMISLCSACGHHSARCFGGNPNGFVGKTYHPYFWERFPEPLRVARRRQEAREKTLYCATEKCVGIQSISHVMYEVSAKTNGRGQECANNGTGVKSREWVYIVDIFILSGPCVCIPLYRRHTSFWPISFKTRYRRY